MSGDEVRARFNELYLQLYDQDELDEEVLYRGAPSKKRNAPSGTMSILAALKDPKTRRVVAICHYYRLFDGTILGPTDDPRQAVAGTGVPDPKEVLVDDVVYHCDESPQIR